MNGDIQNSSEVVGEDEFENDGVFMNANVPIPFPSPVPIPNLRCLKLTPISGRYEGSEIPILQPSLPRSFLDLRVDIDSRSNTSPVMTKISGDMYQQRLILEPSGRPMGRRVYRESWIVDSPVVRWSSLPCRVTITGTVRYYKRKSVTSIVTIAIPYSRFNVGPAEVTFRNAAGAVLDRYVCNKISNAFRDVTLEVDVCKSVNTDPILPVYDTHSHSNRPATIPRRTLTIEQAYDEAGISMTINPSRSIIDDTATQYVTWSVSELHDAMETYFSHYTGSWPKWNVWCLLAGTFHNIGVGGIMFDAGTSYGGSGEPPERQGCAVFRKHSWFSNLVPTPSNEDQFWAMRHYLYTLVHEIGHAFNFLHSWNKGRPDSLSWMNYDWKYDQRNGTDKFWKNFLFRFDDEELIHIRHGDRNSVIMGGDPWASGSHMETPESGVVSIGDSPVQFMVRTKQFFEYLEPVVIELKVKNVSNNNIVLDKQLQPEYGSVVIYIQKPDGRVTKYSPLMEMAATPDLTVLVPDGRHCQNTYLNFGKEGHLFSEPGLYRIRAIYYGLDGIPIPSASNEIRIGYPLSSKSQRDAVQYYSGVTGLTMYVGGSDSPYLVDGMKSLSNIAEDYKESSIGAHISMMLAQNLERPFHRVVSGKRIVTRKSDLQKSLNLLDTAIKQHEKDESTFTNLSYHECSRSKARILATSGKKIEAKRELKGLTDYLRSKKVKEDVLSEIESYSQSL